MKSTHFSKKDPPSVSRVFSCLFTLILCVGLFAPKAQGQNIPDANFAEAIWAACPTCIDANNNLTAAAASLTELNVASRNISSLVGISGFTNLQTLDCRFNQLTSIPTLPNSLTSLDCNSNQLTSLPALPSTLQDLFCTFNQLTSLPNLPNGLEQLACQSNQLTSLPNLPSSLRILYCNTNQLTSLPILPSNLGSLSCCYNQIICLPNLPNSLRTLVIDADKVTCLPNIPLNLIAIYDVNSQRITPTLCIQIPDPNFANAIRQQCPTCIDDCDNLTAAAANLIDLDVANRNIVSLNGIEGFTNLQTLDCNSNQLTSLPALPSHLQNLFCTFNQLTSLPNLPNTLQYLACQGNQLTSLPTLPNSLIILYCNNNQLTSLPILPSNLGSLSCCFNQITCLPNLPNSLRTLVIDADKVTCLPNIPLNLIAIYDVNSQRITPTLCIQIPDNNFANAIRQQCPACIDDCDKLTAAATSLTSLNVAARNILSLNGIHGFTNLQSLRCSDNQLSSIPANLPSGLTDLICNSNRLTGLPTLPTGLVTLRCNDNQLTSLPTLPSTLQGLNCSFNKLTQLPTLPNTLQSLLCFNNQLSNLPALPNGLQILDCLNNQLTALPSLPASLQRLSCRTNQLTSLPALSSSLRFLLCDFNQLTTLPALPATLQYLECNKNLITCLPVLPNGLQYLVLDDDRVTCLPNSPTNLELRNNFFTIISLPLCSPSIVTNPSVSNPICNNSSIVLTAKATTNGTTNGTATIRWQRNGVNIPNTSAAYTTNTDATYSFVPTLGDNGVAYRAVFTGACMAETPTTAATIVLDNIAPQITCPAPLSKNTDLGVCGSVTTFGTPTVTDNCSVTFTQTAGMANGATFPTGISNITFTATDAAGNSSSCSFTVTVLDNEKPKITAPAAITSCIGTGIALGTPVTSDNCSVQSVSNNAPTSYPIGNTTVVWTVTDVNGNSNTASQTVSIAPITSVTPSVINNICNGGNAGSISLAIVGGNAPYTYAWSNGSSAASITNLLAGTYTATVISANGCTKTTSATVTEPTALVVNTANSCQVAYYGYGSTCKTLSVTASGGTGNYTYKWSGGTQTAASIQVFPTVTTNYTVTVTDQNGCSTTKTLRVDVIDVRCGNKNDKASICHNGSVICVSSNAISAHLAHGDKLGDCNAVGCGTTQGQNLSSNITSNTDAAAEIGRNHLQFETNPSFRTNNFTIFPNPATNEAFINLQDYEGQAVSMTLSDISGKTLQKDAIAKAINTPHRLDVAALPTGLYLIKIEAKGKGVVMRKLQVTK